ncbi:MAG: aminopeptidase P family protein [Chloroflexi bacterium]|nr:aminopeptidase P family protein [Chloroflexota bacterium]
MQHERFTRLQKIVADAGLDAIVLVPGANLRYLTGVTFHLSERPLLLIVPKQGNPGVIIPLLEQEKIKEHGFAGDLFVWSDAEGYHGAFGRAIQSMRLAGKRIGVEGLQMRVLEGQLLQEYAPGSHIVPADEELVNLRIIKSAEEVALHRKAIEISEEALRRTLRDIKLGMTERQIAQILTQHQTELGGEQDSFAPLILIGPRSALPHGMPGDTRLERSLPLLIDYGTVYRGYVSDITRTFFVGEPSEKFKALYAAVLGANEAGRQKVHPGIAAEEVDSAAAGILRQSAFAQYIIHRTGHGLGIDIHEHPNIVQGNKRQLEPGMVFTIEPGLYIPGEFGVRIEDNIVVTPDGGKSLTSFPRELMILDL